MNSATAHTRPPAKLNLFLELLARRDDGFHEIDTVMVPIDWRDEIRIRRKHEPGVSLTVTRLPLPSISGRHDSVDAVSPDAASSLNAASSPDIPSDQRNLVHLALTRFAETFAIAGGFECELGKSIPAGAGMGGASSDAASALRCAAALCDLPLDSDKLVTIAAEIGSDVPFFLGLDGVTSSGGSSISGARATGRGELLEKVDLASPLDCVVVFPGVSLSTASVYAGSVVDPEPRSSDSLVQCLKEGKYEDLAGKMMNRLTGPAKKIAPQINEILESLWQADLRTCQLTGSGSACFAIASSPTEAKRCAAQVQPLLEPGSIIVATRSTQVPAPVVVT